MGPKIIASAEVARAMWADGALPSAIFCAMVCRGHRGIDLMAIGKEAFGLSIRDLKTTEHIDPKSWEPLPTFNTWLLPLIQARRPR
jgi:hypothetical protein